MWLEDKIIDSLAHLELLNHFIRRRPSAYPHHEYNTLRGDIKAINKQLTSILLLDMTAYEIDNAVREKQKHLDPN